MKLYAMNDTLLRTSSSSATGLILHNFDTEQLATTFLNNITIQNIIAVITFTNMKIILLFKHTYSKTKLWTDYYIRA
jgi:hypothetical protein